jgi:very-short-patch-repair endonuclease
MSLPEVLIWQRIRGHGFRRQHPLGPFIMDFYRARDRLCIEIDGQQHDLARDARRDVWLADRSTRTVRIAAALVLDDPDAVAEHILSL